MEVLLLLVVISGLSLDALEPAWQYSDRSMIHANDEDMRVPSQGNSAFAGRESGRSTYIKGTIKNKNISDFPTPYETRSSGGGE